MKMYSEELFNITIKTALARHELKIDSNVIDTYNNTKDIEKSLMGYNYIVYSPYIVKCILKEDKTKRLDTSLSYILEVYKEFEYEIKSKIWAYKNISEDKEMHELLRNTYYRTSKQLKEFLIEYDELIEYMILEGIKI